MSTETAAHASNVVDLSHAAHTSGNTVKATKKAPAKKAAVKTGKKAAVKTAAKSAKNAVKKTKRTAGKKAQAQISTEADKFIKHAAKERSTKENPVRAADITREAIYAGLTRKFGFKPAEA